MNEQQKFGLVWYEPAQTYVKFNGRYYFDKNGFVLEEPKEYDYCNGFFKL